MIVRLDPFHLIRGVNCPEPVPPGIVVESAGRMSVTETGVNVNLLCNGDTGPGIFGNYFHQPMWHLSAGLLECSQFDITIRGQTSNVTHYFGFYDELLADAEDCPFPATCDLWIVVDEEMGRANDGSWDTFNERWTHTTRLTTLSDLGFVHNELIDVIVPLDAPSRTILDISNAGGKPLIQVDQNIETQYFEGSWLTVAGTVNYDGQHQVISPGTDLFLLDTAYIADESIGTTTPYYLKQVFFP